MTTALNLASQTQFGTPILDVYEFEQTISPDGNDVAIESFATGFFEVDVKNELNQTVTTASTSSNGVAANGVSFDPTIAESPDGSQVEVGFLSTATNIDPLATSGLEQVYVKNISTGGLTLVSQAGNAAGNSSSFDEALSSNAAFVSFSSFATNLGPMAPAGPAQVYVKDMATGVFVLASQTAGGALANNSAFNQSISADGSMDVFDSSATDLGSTSGASEVYVKNATSATGALSIVSETSGGTIADGANTGGSISADGTKVVFQSTADNLVSGVTSGANEVYLKNLQTGALTLVSATANGVIANGQNFNPILSADGNYVIFESTATNLSPAATSGVAQTYVKNLQTGAVALLSANNTGAAGNNGSFTGGANEQAFSANDLSAVFGTAATNLVPAGGNPAVALATTGAETVTPAAVDGNGIVSASQLSAATFSGVASAPIGSTVTIAIDTANNIVGTTTVGAGGAWSLTNVNLGSLAVGSHTEIATVQDSNDYLSTSANEAFTVDTAGPTVTFDTGIKFSKTKATLTGTVSDPQGVTSLEIDSGHKSLGMATVNANGTWKLTTALPKGIYDDISAKATDTLGNVSITNDPVYLQTGIKNQPYTRQEDDINSLGQDVSDTYTQANGKVYLQDQEVYKSNGASTLYYTAGTYFDSLDYYFQQIDLSPNYATLQQSFWNNDGTHTEIGSANHQQLLALGDDTMTGGGNNETFVFKAHPGNETITDFIATGAGHDVVSLPKSEFGSIAQILADVTQSGSDAVLALGPHSSITFDNVTASALTHADFKLHA